LCSSDTFVEKEAAEKRPWTHIAKVVVIGNAEVGKTSLVVRYVEGYFNPKYLMTIGTNFFVKDIEMGENVLRLQLWDTAGQERFGPIRKLFYRGAKGAILVYDRANPQSFERLDFWLEEVRKGCGEIPIVLVGNKTDLPAKVAPEQGEQFAKERGMLFVESSAKTGLNVGLAFERLSQLVLSHR
jgi:small GTP-binding protein